MRVLKIRDTRDVREIFDMMITRDGGGTTSSHLAEWSPSLPLREYWPSAAAPAFSNSAMYKSPISLSGSSVLPRQSSKSGI